MRVWQAASNPNVTLIVMGVEGDLEAAEVAEIEALAQYRRVEDIVQVRDFSSGAEPRSPG